MNLSESYKNRLKQLSGIISENTQNLDLDKVVHAYLNAMLWTEELDSAYDTHEVDDDSLYNAVKDCKNFIETSNTQGLLNNLSEDDIGHNFWLNRNGHGSGFWDRGLGEQGEKLSQIAKSFKELSVIKPDHRRGEHKISIE